MPRDCGACGLCCKLLNVPDVNKPALMTCWWTTVHGGCARQGEKSTAPELMACAQFKCLWLASQERELESERMPRHMRPDVTHVLMYPEPGGGTNIWIHVDPQYPTAWREPEIVHYLDGIVSRGGMVELVIGDQRVPYNG